MSIDFEHLVHDNPPEPEQLHELTAVGMRSELTRERLKHLRRTRGSAHFFVHEVDLLVGMDEEEEAVQARHRMAVRIGARPPENRMPKVWSFKYIDTFSVKTGPEDWIGERSIYRFEWTRSQVLMADHVMRLIGVPRLYTESDNLDTSLEHFSVRDDSAHLLQVAEQLRMVTADDCDELIRDVSNNLNVVESMPRAV